MAKDDSEGFYQACTTSINEDTLVLVFNLLTTLYEIPFVVTRIFETMPLERNTCR